MFDESILLENNYNKYEDMYHLGSYFYQKKIKEDDKIKYFINIYLKGEYVDLQFENNNYTINMTLFGIRTDMTLEEIETEVDNIWRNLKCNYYE